MEEQVSTISVTEQELNEILSQNHTDINTTNLVVPAVYQDLFLSDFRYFVLSSGRVSGKTSILVDMWWYAINKYPEMDVVILQATASEIKDSIISEIEKFLKASGFEVGEDKTYEFHIPKTYDTIQRSGCIGCTRIFPITDSKGGQRSRGINTKNKISLVLYEEAQKNKDRNVLEQSVITFIRQLNIEAKLVIVGNSETLGHWFVDFVEEKKKDPEWRYIYANCFDIWGLLNEQTKKYILNTQKANPVEFKRIFLGDIKANTSDVVFPQFVRDTDYLRAYELDKHYFQTLIIGIDHATANDTFAIVPVAILDNGTTQTLQVCYDDPEETSRTLAPTEQCEILEEFMDFLDNKYGLVYNRTTVVLSVDGAASPFIAQLKHTKKTAKNRKLWKDIMIKGFTLKKKDINLGIIKNAFAFKVLKILNEGVYDWRGKENKHRLRNEIERQRYKNGKLDPHIKNDLCDALEYGLVPFYTNCFNLSFPIRNARENHYDDIRKLAKIK